MKVILSGAIIFLWAVVLSRHGWGQSPSPFDALRSADQAERPKVIAEVIRSQYRSVRSRVIRVTLERELYRIGSYSTKEKKRARDTTFTHHPTMVCSSQFGRVEGIVKDSGVRLIGIFDGSRGYKYRTDATGGAAFQVDVVCSKPSFVGSFYVFLGITGVGGAFSFPGFYELWSTLEFSAEEMHPEHGRVLVLKEMKELPNGEQSVRHYFGDVGGQLVYRGCDTLSSPRLTPQGGGGYAAIRASTWNSTYSVDYERRAGILFPTSWEFVETSISGDHSNQMPPRARLIERSSFNVIDLEIFDQFPFGELDVPLKDGATIVDRCGPSARIVSDLSEVGTSSNSRSNRVAYIAFVVVVVVLGYVVGWRNRRVAGTRNV